LIFLDDRLSSGSPYAIGTLSVCPVSDVGVLWPNGWTDQDETRHAGRSRSWPHFVRLERSFFSPKRERSPQSFVPYLLWPNG